MSSRDSLIDGTFPEPLPVHTGRLWMDSLCRELPRVFVSTVKGDQYLDHRSLLTPFFVKYR